MRVMATRRLVAVGGESSDAAAVCRHAAEDRGAAVAGGIADAAAPCGHLATDGVSELFLGALQVIACLQVDPELAGSFNFTRQRKSISPAIRGSTPTWWARSRNPWWLRSKSTTTEPISRVEISPVRTSHVRTTSPCGRRRLLIKTGLRDSSCNRNHGGYRSCQPAASDALARRAARSARRNSAWPDIGSASTLAAPSPTRLR